MNTIQTIRSRKSPEAFLSEPLDHETAAAIAEAGNYAPIFGRIHITVITDPDFIETINQVTLDMMKKSGNEFAEKMAAMPGYCATRNAQVLLVLSAPGGMDAMGFHMANVSCAAENMLLAATELGVGSRFCSRKASSRLLSLRLEKQTNRLKNARRIATISAICKVWKNRPVFRQAENRFGHLFLLNLQPFPVKQAF